MPSPKTSLRFNICQFYVLVPSLFLPFLLTCSSYFSGLLPPYKTSYQVIQLKGNFIRQFYFYIFPFYSHLVHCNDTVSVDSVTVYLFACPVLLKMSKPIAVKSCTHSNGAHAMVTYSATVIINWITSSFVWIHADLHHEDAWGEKWSRTMMPREVVQVPSSEVRDLPGERSQNWPCFGQRD